MFVGTVHFVLPFTSDTCLAWPLYQDRLLELSIHKTRKLPKLSKIWNHKVGRLVMWETDFIYLGLQPLVHVLMIKAELSLFSLACDVNCLCYSVHTWCQPWSFFSAHAGGASARWARPLAPASGDATKNKGRTSDKAYNRGCCHTLV